MQGLRVQLYVFSLAGLPRLLTLPRLRPLLPQPSLVRLPLPVRRCGSF